jgi:uncharacterized protein (TIGR03086 family)
MDLDLDTMRRACASTERFVDRVTPADYGRATPCTAWDVRDLLNHLLGTLSLGQALLADAPPAVGMGPGQLPEAELVGDDPAKAYRLGVESLLDAAGGDALDRVHPTPMGDMPGAMLGGFTTLDIVVHGWDLATATGQPAALEPELAESVLAFARQAFEAMPREPRIGPEVAVPAGAPATDRLVGFLGRTP